MSPFSLWAELNLEKGPQPETNLAWWTRYVQSDRECLHGSGYVQSRRERLYGSAHTQSRRERLYGSGYVEFVAQITKDLHAAFYFTSRLSRISVSMQYILFTM